MRHFAPFFTFCLFALSVLFLLPPAFAEDASTLYLKGTRAFNAGDPKTAESLYLEALKTDPYSQKAAYGLAIIYRDEYLRTRQQYSRARDAFTRLDDLLQARAPGTLETSLYLGYLDFGNLLLAGSENRAALSYLNRFLTVYPDYYGLDTVYNSRGVAEFRLNLYDEAASSFRKSYSLNPDYLEPRVNLRGLALRVNAFEEARLAYRMGNYDEALTKVEEVLKIAGGYLAALRLKGDILKATGKEEEALAVYTELLAADPMNPITHGVRLDVAALQEKRGDLNGALNTLNGNASRFRNLPNDPTRAEILRLVDILRKKR